MSREYIQLKCGCFVSPDGVSGLIPCSTDDCEASEYLNLLEHRAALETANPSVSSEFEEES